MMSLGGWMNKVLIGWGIDPKFADMFDETIIALLMVGLSIGLDYLCQAIFVGGMKHYTRRSPHQWNTLLMKRRVIHHLIHILPGILIYYLLPMAFGMILANLPGSGIIHMQYFVGDGLEHPMWVEILNNGGLADMLYMGVKLGIYPPLIFLGIGTMTDFAPLISNPKSLLLGAAAQFGIFGTYMGARLLAATGLVDFTQKQSAAISIIGGADGPTAIFVTSRLAPELLGSIAVAAYSYMALVPVIQPPIMKALTTKKERTVVMKQLRTVSKTERIIFPIMVAIIVSLIVPDAAVLVGMLMLGNLMKECGVVDRIQKTAGNELMNIITIFLALSVGCTTSANTFLNTRTLFIIVLGLIAFSFGTAAGVLCGKVMYKLTGGQVNPLIGSAGVSAVPMAARVSQKVGQSENPSNFLLMHAMGPNVAGVIGSAVAAGILINIFG